MAGNLPKDVVNLFEVKQTTNALYNFLQELNNRLESAERELVELRRRLEELP